MWWIWEYLTNTFSKIWFLNGNTKFGTNFERRQEKWRREINTAECKKWPISKCECSSSDTVYKKKKIKVTVSDPDVSTVVLEKGFQ